MKKTNFPKEHVAYLTLLKDLSMETCSVSCDITHLIYKYIHVLKSLFMLSNINGKLPQSGTSDDIDR